MYSSSLLYHRLISSIVKKKENLVLPFLKANIPKTLSDHIETGTIVRQTLPNLHKKWEGTGQAEKDPSLLTFSILRWKDRLKMVLRRERAPASWRVEGTTKQSMRMSEREKKERK